MARVEQVARSWYKTVAAELPAGYWRTEQKQAEQEHHLYISSRRCCRSFALLLKCYIKDIVVICQRCSLCLEGFLLSIPVFVS